MSKRGRGTEAVTLRRVAALRALAPCGVLPPGTLTRLATDWQVSRQRVSMLARAAGVAVSRRAQATVAVCGRCGGPVGARAQRLCRACRWLVLPCQTCGRDVRRLASTLAYQVGVLGTYQGNVYCSRSCFGRAIGPRAGVALARLADGRRAAGVCRQGHVLAERGRTAAGRCRACARAAYVRRVGVVSAREMSEEKS